MRIVMRYADAPLYIKRTYKTTENVKSYIHLFVKMYWFGTKVSVSDGPHIAISPYYYVW